MIIIAHLPLQVIIAPGVFHLVGRHVDKALFCLVLFSYSSYVYFSFRDLSAKELGEGAWLLMPRGRGMVANYHAPSPGIPHTNFSL